jgi:stage II sporulation protein P
MLSSPLKITQNDSKEEPTVFILHTHASEAYADQSGGRSEDTAHNVVQIGDVLAETLEECGIGVVHCREIIDSPSYNQSYNRAMEIIDEQLEETPSIKVVIDVHRDSMITDSGTEYKVVSEVDGQRCAQLMMVMGTNAGGLTHPNWKSNLNFACNLQKSILETYPTLMRPVNLRAQRFNEQATTGSMILECGTSGNTMTEAEIAVKAFAKKLAEALKDS